MAHKCICPNPKLHFPTGRGRYVRERLVPPKKLYHMRTITRGKHKLVVGCPISVHRGRCPVGTVAQSILHPPGEFKNPIFPAKKANSHFELASSLGYVYLDSRSFFDDSPYYDPQYAKEARFTRHTKDSTREGLGIWVGYSYKRKKWIVIEEKKKNPTLAVFNPTKKKHPFMKKGWMLFYDDEPTKRHAIGSAKQLERDYPEMGESGIYYNKKTKMWEVYLKKK